MLDTDLTYQWIPEETEKPVCFLVFAQEIQHVKMSTLTTPISKTVY